MSEIAPQFTYEPDGILKVQIDYEDPQIYEGKVREGQGKAMDALSEHRGVEIEGKEDRAMASIDVQEALGSSFNNRGDEKILKLLTSLSLSLPYTLQGTSDRVVALDSITTAGTFSGIYPQFQRWMNSQGLDADQGINEDVAKIAVGAMATPFGKALTRKALKNFRPYPGGGDGGSFRVSTMTDRFGIRSESQRGDVRWNWVYLTTLGSCACWGVNGDDKEYILIRDDEARLYQMTPHNVDFARQTLSHILGLGVLAHQAAEYEGQEDIYADTEWRV